MKTVTWALGSDNNLDNLFDSLREIQYKDTSHRLWKNYDREFLKSVVATTICFEDSGEPTMCSSISERDCWPKGAYRILNRLWKVNNKIVYPRKMSPSFAESAKSQIEWLKNNVDCKLYFISRQTDNWETWVINNFDRHYQVKFTTDSYKYLTCPNESDSTCWQKIIYNGEKKLLKKWTRLKQ